MQLSPRYGADPLLTMDGAPGDIAAPAIRQRKRLAATVAAFTDEQWAQPSRCEGWSNRDVIVHLDSTNSFWAFAISAGVQGAPTQFLATFDPVASPAQLVTGAGERSIHEVLTSFVASTDALVELWESLDDGGWSSTAEARPGHVSVSTVTHHALWDSWVHERDILLPLGIAAAERRTRSSPAFVTPLRSVQPWRPTMAPAGADNWASTPRTRASRPSSTLPTLSMLVT